MGEAINNRFPDPELEEVIHLVNELGANRLSELARHRVLERLAAEPQISGRLDLLDFLGRIFPVNDLFSNDPRYSTLADEIWQHMVNNDDWDHDFLFQRLGLLGCSENCFIRFLELCVDPVVGAHERRIELVEALNEILALDETELSPVDVMSGELVYKVIVRNSGVGGRVKNLIFAANGPKPEIILQDAINNDVRITKNTEYCLVFDRPLRSGRVTWGVLLDWWLEREGFPKDQTRVAEESLYRRLMSSLSSPPEKKLFRRYFEKFQPLLGVKMPALIPQVYLHYDPYTARLRKEMAVLSRQRMDFLLLFSAQSRVVIEVDGKQHYSDKGGPSPRLYGEMVSADRDLRLIGYEVYRFGGFELTGAASNSVVDTFFKRLFVRHGVGLSSA